MTQDCHIRKIIKRDGSIVKYDRGRIVAAVLKATVSVGRPDPALADSIAAQVESALKETYGPDSMPSVEDIQDVVENTLMANRLTAIARNYIIYRHQRAMERAARSYTFEVTDNIPYKKIYEVLRWNMDHSCDSVSALNRLISDGSFADLARSAEERFKREIEQGAALIADRRDAIRIVIVAGPSSSGKTTTTIMLSEQLKRAGMRIKPVNLDNYFFDLELHPKDEFGDYDYETPKALDIELVNKHLAAVVGGETVRTPRYDFKTGLRTMNANELSLQPGEILMIDSLHGLYPAVTESVPEDNKFKVYIETLGQLRGEDGAFMRWADNRLLRRMIRDKQHRSLQPMQTLTHWHYVRRSELKNIIPFIGTADFVINSALPYETPILKARLFDIFPEAVAKHENNPQRLDAYIRAKRICGFLAPLKGMADDNCVPSTSLLREFIGGSSYKY